MCHPSRHDVHLDPGQIEQLKEIHRAACRVKARLPAPHPAGITAAKLIAAFTGQGSCSEVPLREMEPGGTA